LTPLKLVIGGLAMYNPATIFAVSAGTAVLLAPSQFTISGHVFEKVLFSGVNAYWVFVPPLATVIFTVPVLTQSLRVASNRLTRPIFPSDSNK
jgi:hypothetical protein